MKVWWVYAWNQYYPSSCLGDLIDTFATAAEAEVFADGLKDTGNYSYVEVVDISDRLY
jgi:hypothetical protein